MVSTPPSQGSAVWKTLLSGSSTITFCQPPLPVSRRMTSRAGPGTGCGLPSGPVVSRKCAWVTNNAGKGPPTSGSRTGAGGAAGAAAGAAAVGAGAAGAWAGVSSPPPQAADALTSRIDRVRPAVIENLRAPHGDGRSPGAQPRDRSRTAGQGLHAIDGRQSGQHVAVGPDVRVPLAAERVGRRTVEEGFGGLLVPEREDRNQRAAGAAHHVRVDRREPVDREE